MVGQGLGAPELHRLPVAWALSTRGQSCVSDHDASEWWLEDPMCITCEDSVVRHRAPTSESDNHETNYPRSHDSHVNG
jgi:hypothetical protein